MNKILREKFVELHKENLLEDLYLQFSLRFPQVKFPTPPKRGDLDLNVVKDSVYFFN